MYSHELLNTFFQQFSSFIPFVITQASYIIWDHSRVFLHCFIIIKMHTICQYRWLSIQGWKKSSNARISNVFTKGLCGLSCQNIKHCSFTLFEINGKQHERTYCCLHMLHHILTLQNFPKATFKMFKKQNQNAVSQSALLLWRLYSEENQLEGECISLPSLMCCSLRVFSYSLNVRLCN